MANPVVAAVAAPEPAGVKLKRKVSSLFKKRNTEVVAGGGDVGAEGVVGGGAEPARGGSDPTPKIRDLDLLEIHKMGS